MFQGEEFVVLAHLTELIVLLGESFAKGPLQHYLVTKRWAVYTSVSQRGNPFRDRVDDQDHHKRLYLQHPYQREFSTPRCSRAPTVVRTVKIVFYPGGGGQRHDSGYLILHGDAVAVSEIREDAAGRICIS
jgi:hypothetical protein